jgi:hypothetical protein
MICTVASSINQFDLCMSGPTRSPLIVPLTSSQIMAIAPMPQQAITIQKPAFDVPVFVGEGRRTLQTFQPKPQFLDPVLHIHRLHPDDRSNPTYSQASLCDGPGYVWGFNQLLRPSVLSTHHSSCNGQSARNIDRPG